jgi:hypothetical protein
MRAARRRGAGAGVHAASAAADDGAVRADEERSVRRAATDASCRAAGGRGQISVPRRDPRHDAGHDVTYSAYSASRNGLVEAHSVAAVPFPRGDAGYSGSAFGAKEAHPVHGVSLSG